MKARERATASYQADRLGVSHDAGRRPGARLGDSGNKESTRLCQGEQDDGESMRCKCEWPL